MKKSIVLKWFGLTVLLFSTLFLAIGIAQTYFFEEYYLSKKAEELSKHTADYSQMVAKEGVESTSLEFYTAHRVWITELDQYGRIRDVENYYIEVNLEGTAHDHMRIPMYTFEGEFSSDVLSVFAVGDEVLMDVVQVGNERIPYLIQSNMAGAANLTLANKLHGAGAEPAYAHLNTELYKGTITKTVFPDRAEHIAFPYQERLFMQQVKEFQTRLLVNNGDPRQGIEELNPSEDFSEYKVVIEPIDRNGDPGYIFAITSLQPVDEALSAMRQFYPYVVGFALLSIAFLAFIVSRWLAKPLISLNQITGKIANMDFSEKLPVRSEDEIGQLSGNINHLSDQIEAYINRLQGDLDKERQLEKVRKEFIAGVSHELKTPLAVLRCCLSIIRDGIAVEKRDYYFQAMEDEVQRMDSLVVNMLDLAKFESGTYKPKMAIFRIDEAITEVTGSLAGHVQAKELSLELRLQPYRVEGHEGLISRVISNFLSNAIRHSPQGRTITISVQREGQYAKISIENQGSTLSEESQKMIWNQFYRIEGPTFKVGTGLGLSISKEILELHHAIYGVENTQGGVCFFFSLPIRI